MTKCVNKVTLLGYVGVDPEVRETSARDKIAKLRLATTNRWKDSVTGERKENTEWHNVVFFKGLASIVAQYVGKGDKLYLEGHLKTSRYEDSEGAVKFFTEIIADDLSLLSDKQKLPAVVPALEIDDAIPF